MKDMIGIFALTMFSISAFAYDYAPMPMCGNPPASTGNRQIDSQNERQYEACIQQWQNQVQMQRQMQEMQRQQEQLKKQSGARRWE